MYVEGSLTREPSLHGGRVSDRELTGFQKVVELIASIIEASRKSHALERWLAVYKSYLPSAVRTVPDPDRMRQLLTPRQATVTVMFCDLRGSCRIVEQGEASLMQTWKNVADALDEMAKTRDAIAALGVRGLAWPLDVCSNESVDAFHRAAIGVFGQIDILVNAAGSSTRHVMATASAIAASETASWSAPSGLAATRRSPSPSRARASAASSAPTPASNASPEAKR